jgi:hypothetical protein
MKPMTSCAVACPQTKRAHVSENNDTLVHSQEPGVRCSIAPPNLTGAI